jgi:predicted CoA-binding protein
MLPSCHCACCIASWLARTNDPSLLACLPACLAAFLTSGQIDILDVFRKPSDIPQHLDDILAAAPKAVWLQSGITHPQVEEQLARAGIKVVSDRCLKVDHQQAVMHSRM